MTEYKVKTTIVESIAETRKEDYKHPTKFYFINALGQLIYIHTRTRSIAEDYVEKEYGKRGFYKIHATSLETPKGEITVRGVATRKGQKK